MGMDMAMAITPELLAHAHLILARSNSTTNGTSSTDSSTTPNRPPVYKAIGIALAIASGLFIGTSFVLKKTGLLKANAKYNEEAGEGYGYLKNAYWWTGMTLMIIGEICNFVAYAFVDAILVTPLGALSVVITTVLSAIFLKERLSFVGKAGCFSCIIGSVVIVMNAPQQSSVSDIQEMQHFVLAPGFLTYAGVIIVGSAFIALWVGPRYGKKSMLVYLSVCSLIGGLSVVATQGLGSAVVAQASGKSQFTHWFLYVLLVFVVATLVTEIIFLNVSTVSHGGTGIANYLQKALNLFNAALVTPTYYVFFTSSTIVTSAILFQGFKGSVTSIVTVVLGFFQICTGVVLLQLSKSAKDVPDAAVFKGDLDQMREVAEQEQPESEPKADAIRGAVSIVRRFSQSRQKMELEEARRLREDKMKDQLEPLQENEVVEWDGLRRRKTVVGSAEFGGPVRRKTMHPPLGMSHFPDESQDQDNDREVRDSHTFFEGLRGRAQSVLHPHQNRNPSAEVTDPRSPIHPVALTEINVGTSKADTPILPYGPGSFEEAQEHIYGLPQGIREGRNQSKLNSPRSKPLPGRPRDESPASATRFGDTLAPERPEHSNRRQFSFTNVFHRSSRTPDRPTSSDANYSTVSADRPKSRVGVSSRSGSSAEKKALKTATEEERLGLVKGDSHALLHEHSPPRPAHSDPDLSAYDQYPPYDLKSPTYPLSASPVSEDDEDDDWQMMNPRSTHALPTPPRHLTQQEQPQQQIYQPPPNSSPPQQMIGQTRAPLDPSQTSSTKTQTHLPSTTYRLPQYTSQTGDPMERNVSPEDYDPSRRRFEQQRRQGRGPDESSGNNNGAGSGSTGARGAFI